MTTELTNKENNYPARINEFEKGLISFLDSHNLPTTGIFNNVDERLRVFSNIDYVIKQIDPQLSQKSIYLSKFLAASASGLFDASLNYLWDETILQLRKRVSQFDLEYFYDITVGGERRKNFKDESDLVKLQDSELINGAKEIELISELGFKHLTYINYMRNWASAAHPNQIEITGLQLISWLETCIKEVISLPIPSAAIQIKKLLSNIRKEPINAENADQIGVFLTELSEEQSNSLAMAFFGIYTRVDTDNLTRQNIKWLLPLLWKAIDEETKNSFGIKYGYFSANHETEQKKLSRQFLEIVEGQKYIPDDLRILEIQSALNNLANAHRATNNFYNEPPFARELRRIIGTPPKIPNAINKGYVLTLVEVYLTNGNGVTWEAQPIYRELIEHFDNRQATIALLSFTTDQISSSLQLGLCKLKFVELLNFLRPKITNASTIELLDFVLEFKGSYAEMRKDSRIIRVLKNLEILLK
ncbi:MAG: hypothetical protein QM534_19290 [Sediminibacterium sp.]|nr:hypothetical protein [Sediminibacterium sp.]